MKIRILWGFILTLLSLNSIAQLTTQKEKYTWADTLRGSLRPERTCYDVTYYDLRLKVDTGEKSINGSNRIVYDVKEDFTTLQIDLFEAMRIVNIVQNGKELRYRREFNAVFVEFDTLQKAETKGEITVNYHGVPTKAKRAPWDGGFTWSYNREGKVWMAVSCEGIGASLWWPCKDYLGDEPDSMTITTVVPTGLKCISNGRMEAEAAMMDGYNIFVWKVSYPINSYNVTLNVGDYVSFHDTYQSEDGSLLDLDYYVMPYNLEKAKKQFEQVKPMMKCYEKFLGKYPFWNDGYALVETPYLGMEHQGAIAYGNRYLTGYAGMDFSKIGLDFDYIIIHESGHEWWGNSVSCQDIADMWIHEGFCTYAEAIYVECLHGYETALKYINAKAPGVDNKVPVVGVYGVNEEGDGDMYSKGSLFLNTVRHIVDNDKEWWRIIKNMSDTIFKMRNTNYGEVVAYFNQQTGMNLSPVFEQYLKYPAIPVLEYKLTRVSGKEWKLEYHWVTDVTGFSMPFYYQADKQTKKLKAGNEWSSVNITMKKAAEFSIDRNLTYIQTREIN